MRDKDEAELEKLTKQQEREYRKMQKERRKSHE